MNIRAGATTWSPIRFWKSKLISVKNISTVQENKIITGSLPKRNGLNFHWVGKKPPMDTNSTL